MKCPIKKCRAGYEGDLICGMFDWDHPCKSSLQRELAAERRKTATANRLIREAHRLTSEDCELLSIDEIETAWKKWSTRARRIGALKGEK